MPTGLMVPVQIETSTSPVVTEVADPEFFLETLSAEALTKHLFPSHRFAILADRNAEDDGMAVNSLATDLLWQCSPSTYLARMVHGHALIFGYVDATYIDLPEPISAFIAKRAQMRTDRVPRPPRLRVV